MFLEAADTAKVTINDVNREAMLPANKGSILVELARVISFPPAIFTRNQVNTPTNKPVVN